MNKFSSPPSLCIGIPTYNRPEALCRRINEIKQYTDTISEILICDNSEHTHQSVMDCISDLNIKCTYIKNSANIGAGANFLRVLENATSDYLWWRGDDDVISADQVAAVKGNLTSDPGLLLISNKAKEIFSSKGIDGFVDNFDKVESMTWASQVIVPVTIAKKGLPWGYRAIDWAHIAIIIRLFHSCPDLKFTVAPYTLKENEFRDVGREGLGWAFFNTTIKNFPDTASILPNPSLRKRYLTNWRKTKNFLPLIRTMVGMKLGISTQENISPSTFFPLLSFGNPRCVLLTIVLYLMSIIPKFAYQIVFSLAWTRMSIEKKTSFRLDFLMPHTTFYAAYRAIRNNHSAGQAE